MKSRSRVLLRRQPSRLRWATIRRSAVRSGWPPGPDRPFRNRPSELPHRPFRNRPRASRPSCFCNGSTSTHFSFTITAHPEGRFGRRIRCDYGNFRVADCSNMPACDVSKERPIEMKSGILDKLAFFIVIRAGKRGSRPCPWLAPGATTVDAISRCRAQPCAGHPPFASPPGGLKARGPSPAKTIRANGAADLHNRISLRGQRCASRE